MVVSRPPIWRSMSCCTRMVAVAVAAKIGRLCGSNFTKSMMRRNAGRKSWPQVEMVCASSITTIDRFIRRVASIHASSS